MGRKERKKICGYSNNDKQIHYKERVKPQLPNFEMVLQQTERTTLSDTQQGLGTTYSEFQLTQRPKWIKTQSQLIDREQFDDNRGCFIKTPKLSLSHGSIGNFSSMQTQQFLLPAITSNVDDHLSTFKQKHANSTTIPNLNLIAKKLHTMSLNSTLNDSQANNSHSKYSEDELMHHLNQKLKKNLRSDIAVTEEERLQLTELQKLLEIKEVQKLDNKRELDLQFSRNFITSVESDQNGLQKTSSSLFEDSNNNIINRTGNGTGRSMTASSIFKPTKSIATLVPQKKELWKNESTYENIVSSYMVNDYDSVISNESLHRFNKLKHDVKLDDISFAPSRIQSLQLLEKRAVELDNLCATSTQKFHQKSIANDKSQNIFNNMSSTMSSTADFEPSALSLTVSQGYSTENFNSTKNRPKTTSQLGSSLNPYTSNPYVSRKNSIVMKVQNEPFKRNGSTSTYQSENNSEYYDSDHGGAYDDNISESAMSRKTGKKLVPQPTPYLSRQGISFSRESPNYQSVASIYNDNHGLSAENLADVIRDQPFQQSQFQLSQGNNNNNMSRASTATTAAVLPPRFGQSDADVEYLKRKVLREAKYNKSQELIRAMKDREEQNSLKVEVCQ